MKKVAIVGFGRFGKLLAGLATNSFKVHIVESSEERRVDAEIEGYTILPIDKLGSMDIIFLAVPISSIESVAKKIAPLLSKSHVVIDLCSVKVHPVNIMKKHLVGVQILGSHPMFGPDSAKEGIKGLQVALCPISVSEPNIKIVSDFWDSLGAEVIETTPEQHDQDAVYSQAFTYSLANIILRMELPDITFKTKSYRALTEVARISANDSRQLFHDMLFYNPYFSDMKSKLEQSLQKTLDTLATIEVEQKATKSDKK